jgi:antitoxin (DNA-binding transcriptional repressor) of toxin-antitoxin stability system
MSTTTSIRDLRNHFPKIRRLVETQGEVLLTEKGQPRYRLTLYTQPNAAGPPPPKDYLERLRRYQPQVSSGTGSVPLHEDNRGER